MFKLHNIAFHEKFPKDIMNGLFFNIYKLKGVNCKIKKLSFKIFFFREKNRGIHWRQIHLYYRVPLL